MEGKWITSKYIWTGILLPGMLDLERISGFNVCNIHELFIGRENGSARLGNPLARRT